MEPNLAGIETARPLDIAIAPEPEHDDGIKPLSEIGSMDEYLEGYGKILGKKAITSLAPLHVPGRDPLPDFSDLLRDPFDPQKHVVAAAITMLDEMKNGFICGEMGTGKTLIGMVAVDRHARRPRNKGGSNGEYRCIVLCPDHLIAKWEREITETIPDAEVVRFDNWKGIVTLLDRGHRGRWAKPRGPEFYVVGRNQAKWYPDWLGISDPYRGFAGKAVEKAVSGRTIPVDRVAKMVDDKPVYDPSGRPVMETITARTFACPRCGTVARDRKGIPLSAKDLSKSKQTCAGRYMVMLPEPEKKADGLDIMSPMPKRYADKKPGQEVNHGGKKYVVKECREPLWWFTSRPYRFPPARIIQKKMRRFFDYLLIDECHEQKSDESAQSMACSKLIAAVRHSIALTGTIIGGYADHLFPLMMRLNPQSLREEGFEWGKDLPFSEVYGRIDRIVTTKEEGAEVTVGKNVRSMRRAKSGKASQRKAVRPGIMPTMFGRHLIGNSMFITLDQMADELPDLHEYIGGEKPEGLDEVADAFWVDTACTMEDEQKAEYNRIEAVMDFVNKELLRKGSMKFLGSSLWTSLDYPDKPYGWVQDKELVAAIKIAQAEGIPVPPGMEHPVGYWDKQGKKTIDNWVGVVTPKDLPEERVYPKEQKLIDICTLHKRAGNQVWVYVQMTGKRNVQPRLAKLLEAEGLKVGVLRSDDVDPKEREDWIARHGREFDVVICHPKLVSTGLDLFSKVQGGHNFNCIVFYQTGYNLFDMRQAARRAWRIGQPKDCFVYYLYYKGTMQHRAMSLMSRKMAAAHALEGEFSEEGLAAMAGEDNLQMALAKSIAEKIDESDMQRSWSKIKSGEKKKVRRPTEAIKALAAGAPPSPLDTLPAEVQLVARTMIERQGRPTPAAAMDDIDRLAETLARIDIAVSASAPEPQPEPEPVVTAEPDPAELAAVALKVYRPEPEPRADDDIPELTEEILARMFANMMANGMDFSDLTG